YISSQTGSLGGTFDTAFVIKRGGGGYGFGVNPPSGYFEVSGNTTLLNQFRPVFRNRNTNPGTFRVAHLEVTADGGNEAVSIRVGKSNAGQTFQQINSDTYLGLAVGGADIAFVRSSSFSVSVPVLQTAQPNFLAFNNATDVDVTGNNTTVIVDFNQEDYDVGTIITGSTVTVNLTGKYYFSAGVTLNDTTSANNCELRLVTTSRTYVQESVPAGARTALSINVIAAMTEGD